MAATVVYVDDAPAPAAPPFAIVIIWRRAGRRPKRPTSYMASALWLSWHSGTGQEPAAQTVRREVGAIQASTDDQFLDDAGYSVTRQWITERTAQFDRAEQDAVGDAAESSHVVSASTISEPCRGYQPAPDITQPEDLKSFAFQAAASGRCPAAG